MEKARKFGTFAGVYTPALLTIISVIMFLRLGWIVGQVGLLYTVGIILVANLISITTGLSLSSIATDKKVKAGGVYYMLSRSMGLSIGGAIGLTMYIAFCFSIALNIIGFTESFLAVDFVYNLLGMELNSTSFRITGTVILLVLTVIALISTSLAIKVQYLVLTGIVLSLASIFIGLFLNSEFHPSVPLIGPAEFHPSMALMFAVFFPAATGFMMGAAMSGDLKDPRFSIPRGTMLAILTGMLINLSLAVGIAFFVDRDILISDSAFLQKVSYIPVLVIIGIWGATLSTALGGIIGAPRVIQAMAKDKTAPSFLSKGYGINNEPRRAIYITFIIALAAILIGDLNTIARVATMFFITAYAFINLAFALEKWASTDFRPSFKVPGWVGWIGFGASFLVMLQIDFLAMIIAFSLLWLVWYIMKRREYKLEPGDVWQSVWSNIVRRSIHNMYAKGIEERNWKPNIMLFTGNPANLTPLSELGKALIANHGLLTIMNIKKTENIDQVEGGHRQRVKKTDNGNHPGVFLRQYQCSDIYKGIENLAETYGFSGVEPNTIMLGWPGIKTGRVEFISLVQRITELDINLLIMNYDSEKGFGKRKTIDIWWRGSGNNGNLAINLVKFLWLSEGWKESRLRLMIENPVNDERDNIYNFATEVLDNLRVNAKVVIINNEIEKKPYFDIVRIESADTDIVFIGLPDIKSGAEEKTFNKIDSLMNEIGTIVLVKASTQFKKLNIGVKRAPESDLNVQQERLSLEKAETIASGQQLQLPQRPGLLVVIADFAEKTLKLNDRLVEKSFGKILSVYNEILANAWDRVNTTFAIIARRTHDRSDQYKEAVNTLYKLSNNTYIRYEQILVDLRDQMIEEQRKNLEIFFAAFEKDTHELLAALPEQTTIVLTADEIAKVPSDTRGVRALKRKLLLTTGDEVKLYVRTKKIVSQFYPQSWYYIRKQLWRKFSSISGQYFARQQEVFKEFRKSLHKMEIALSDNTLTDEMLQLEREGIRQNFDRLKEFLATSQTNLLLSAREENISLLLQITRIFDALNPNAVYREEKHNLIISKSDIRIMNGYPEDWKIISELIINQNLLEMTLSATEYKLWHFTGKTADELKAIGYSNDDSGILHQPVRILKYIDEALEKYGKGEDPDIPVFQFEVYKDLHRKIKDIEDTIQSRINTSLSRIPSSTELLKDKSVTSFTENRLIFVKKQSIEVSRLIHFLVQSELLTPVHAELKRFLSRLSAIEQEIVDISRLIRISLANDKEESIPFSPAAFLQEQKQRVVKVQEKIYQLFVSTDDALNAASNNVSHSLSLPVFLKTAENLRLLEKGRDAKAEKESYLKRISLRVKDFLRRNLIKLWYDRSRRIVYAQQKQGSFSYEGFPVREIHELNEFVSARDHVLQNIPAYYQQLFLRKNNYFMDFWQGKPLELEQARAVIARHARGYNGALLISGENNSGKTFFVNYIVDRFLKHKKVYYIQPPFAGSCQEEDFLVALQKALDNKLSLKQAMGTLSGNAVIIIEDMELWWEKTTRGLEVIKLISSIIEKYGSKVLFIITANSHAYASIRRFLPFDTRLLGEIRCNPYNAEELKSIIMQRHSSGNLKFIYNHKKESEIRSWDLARLFNTYFNYTRGNVGLSLQTWMACIEKAEEDFITIRAPYRPDTSALNKLDSETLIFLVQFILHKRLSMEKMQRIMLMSADQVKHMIRLLKRAALITEPAMGVFILNPNLHSFIRERLIEKELL